MFFHLPASSTCSWYMLLNVHLPVKCVECVIGINPTLPVLFLGCIQYHAFNISPCHTWFVVSSCPMVWTFPCKHPHVVPWFSASPGHPSKLSPVPHLAVSAAASIFLRVPADPVWHPLCSACPGLGLWGFGLWGTHMQIYPSAARLFLQWLCQFILPPVEPMGFQVPTSFPNLSFIHLPNFCLHHRYEVVSHCAEQLW